MLSEAIVELYLQHCHELRCHEGLEYVKVYSNDSSLSACLWLSGQSSIIFCLAQMLQLTGQPVMDIVSRFRFPTSQSPCLLEKTSVELFFYHFTFSHCEWQKKEIALQNLVLLGHAIAVVTLTCLLASKMTVLVNTFCPLTNRQGHPPCLRSDKNHVRWGWLDNENSES